MQLEMALALQRTISDQVTGQHSAAMEPGRVRGSYFERPVLSSKVRYCTVRGTPSILK